MRFIALKELPQGQQPGEEFDATEDAGAVLILVGAARKADETTDDVKSPRGRYRRTDLRAEAAEAQTQE